MQSAAHALIEVAPEAVEVEVESRLPAPGLQRVRGPAEDPEVARLMERVNGEGGEPAADDPNETAGSGGDGKGAGGGAGSSGGEGGSGGAIALAGANRVLILEHSIYSVISPEGAASILWRDGARAKDFYREVFGWQLNDYPEMNYTGVASRSIIAESFELGPFHKQLFSSDAWGPAELHYLGAVLWRRGVTSVIGDWVASGDWSQADAERVLRLVASENAERVYSL